MSTAPHAGRQHGPVGVGLHAAVIGGGAGIKVVGEDDAVPDEDLVLDLDPFADERMRGDLAPPANDRILLNLNERPDPGAAADAAPVQVDKVLVKNNDAILENDRLGNRHA